MEILKIILQVIIAAGIFNVWVLRFQKTTDWRGGDSTTLKQEFAAYGLPETMLYLVGFLKITFAVLMLVGIWIPVVVDPAAAGMAVLMLGAITMHFKVNDPMKKALPSMLMLLMCFLLLVL